MAVTLTTKFYEEDTPDWHNLSKIVFTSPNMDSPNTAGTRSHIFPGGDIPLGLWYEDTSHMYRIESIQETDNSTYYSYSAQLHNNFDLDNPTPDMFMGATEQLDWIEYIRQRVGSWPMEYTESTESDIYGYLALDVECTISGSNESAWPNMFESILTDDGWISSDPAKPQYVEFMFSSAVIINFIEFASIDIFSNVRNFCFQAKSNPGDSYSDLKCDSIPYNDYTVKTFYFTNFNECKYYRLYITTTWGAGDAKAGAKNFKAKGYYRSDFTLDYAVSSSGTAEDAFVGNGWYADESGITPHWVRVGFFSPKRITKIIFDDQSSDYGVKDYKLQASNTISGTYVDIYSERGAGGNIFSNYIPYKYYRLYLETRYVHMLGYGVKNLTMYEYAVDESVTDPVILYFDNNNSVDISHANNADSADYLFKLSVDSTTGSGVVASGTNLYGWGWPGWQSSSVADVNSKNSVVFETTFGECYDCRLTAWDDSSHSSTTNEIITGDHCRVSALVFSCKTSILTPTEDVFIFHSVCNRIFKGNTIYMGTKYYYGDFDMRYRSQSDIYGDFLMFKPMLYGIHSGISYGVHDFLITLHYSYT